MLNPSRIVCPAVLKLILILSPILFSACATGRRGDSSRSGYTEEQLTRNVFLVSSRAGPRTFDVRATELCLLRCADVALSHGFGQFVVLASESLPSSSGQSPASPKGAAGLTIGRSSYLSAQSAKPSSSNTIACFRQRPPQFVDVYDARATYDQLAFKYQVHERAQAPARAALPDNPQFDLDPLFLLLPNTTPDLITFLEPSNTRQTFLIGEFTDWENPYASLEEFKRKAAATAAVLGGHAILIRDRASGGEFVNPSENNARFVAELLLVPKARLGIQDEEKGWPRNEIVIRGFNKDSLAQRAGLQIGDHILELDGTSVERQKPFVDRCLAWSVGEDVVVTFERNGARMITQAKTIAN